MNCIIPSPNLKILGKAVHALSKIGDEIYFEANEDHLSLRAVNITTTVFGKIKFLSSSFFTHYKINDAESEQSSQKGISCKMPMKAMLAVFRNPNQMDRQISLCKIELNENPTKITFKFRYKNDVSKTHEVLLLDGDESLQVTIVNDSCNEITGNSSVYTQALANFQLSDEDVSMEVTPQLCILRNYIESEYVTEKRYVRSQLSINPSEFKHYCIKKDTTIAFTLRSFRAIIQFAETFNLNITLNFQESGKPMEIIISNTTTIEAKFILATMTSNLNTQTTATTTTTDCPSKQSFIQKEAVLEKSTVKNKHYDYFNSEELDKDINNIPDEVIMIPNSPESPRSKRIKFHFKRCFEPTFNGLPSTNEEIYAENSDPECEALMY